MDNHQKRDADARLAFEEGEGVIRPAAFTDRACGSEEKKADIKTAVWTEEDATAASKNFKEQYVEEVAMTACEGMLRTFAAAGLCDLDKENVKQFLMAFESIKALGCAAAGVEHPFHSVAEKIVAEPDNKTRSLVGFMVMSAEGSLIVNPEGD